MSSDMLLQQPLPPEYTSLTWAELDERIAAAKAALGKSVVILGHHYQREEVIKFADFRGDSFKLSQLAAGRKEVDYIVFCGVHFMAESADILSGAHQKVILPDLSAGCSMADMADIDQVAECWESLCASIDDTIIPITYMNSTAALKAFVGENGGAVCTSSNAEAVMRWGFEQGRRLLFFPDQHLGRNTAVYRMGMSGDECGLWDPRESDGGLAKEHLRNARVFLWKGHCSVHQLFTPKQVERAREEHPGINILVHPECCFEVVGMADFTGSTEYIIKKVEAAPTASKWAIGTEINLVNRLAKEHPDKLILSLDECVCVCSTMYRIDPPHLLRVLDNLLEGNVVNQIAVPPETQEWARVALNRMLEIT